MPNTTNTILKTKLYRPLVTPEHVLRQFLIDLLEKNKYKPFTLVSAGAGYGKSMVLSSWIEQKKNPCAWVSLSEDESELKVFLRYIYYAIVQLYKDALPQLGSFLDNAKLPPFKVIVNTLINELDEIEEPFILVLDDYHLINDNLVHDLINEILNYPTEQMHLVISTRMDPPLRLNNLRAHDRITELRAQDLVFNIDEIIDLYQKAKSVVLEDAVARELERSTEGWITGLKLIAFVPLEKGNENILLKEFSERASWANEFLFEEVFSKQPDWIKEKLLCSSLFQPFSVELLSAVLAEDNSEENEKFIDWLLTTNLFIIPLDRENNWFRYHHFFHELLEVQVAKNLDKEKKRVFYHRAAEWCLENNYLEEAIKYSIASGEVAPAIKIIEANRNIEIENDRWHELEKWLQYIPEKFLAQNPVFQLTFAWICYQQTRFLEVLDIINDLEKNYDILQLKQSYQGEVSFFKGMISYFSGEKQKASQYLLLAVQKLEGIKGLILGETELLYALSLQMNGDKEKAIWELQKGIKTAKKTDLMYLTRIQTGMNYAHILSADFLEAKKWSLPMMRVMKESGSAYALSWGYYLDGYIDFNLLRLDKAMNRFQAAIDLRYISDMGISVNAYIGSILCLQIMGSEQSAQDLLEEMLAFVSEIDNRDFLEIVPSYKARYALINGNLTEALDWASTFLADEKDVMSIFLWIEVPIITQVRVLVKNGQEKDLINSLATLDNLLHTIRDVHFECQELDVLLLQALAFYKLQKRSKAQNILKEAVTIASSQSWLRPFVEIGIELFPMLQRLKDEGFQTDFVDIVLEELRPVSKKSIPSATVQHFENPGQSGMKERLSHLTQRELETVKWLAHGLRNKEIADKMYISVGAVKKHLYRSYQKLEVPNRLGLIKELRFLNFASLDPQGSNS